jgi:RNA polymerase subunit RPABC4/transcription elongation factor Spt4
MSDHLAPGSRIECADCGATIDLAIDRSHCPACGSENRRIEVHDRAVLTAEEEAQISKRIDQSFDIAREILENPSILNGMSEKATLAIYDADANGRQRSSASPRPFHSFWQVDQALEALRILADFLKRAPDNPYLWKWVVLAMHDAMQGFMGLALRSTHGAQLLVPRHERREYQRWAEERRLGKAVPTGPRQIDSFLKLYEKVQDPSRMRHFIDSRALSPTPTQDEAIKALDAYRKELTHYGDLTLVLNIAWLPTLVLEALSVAEWLLEESNTMLLRPEEQERFRANLRQVKEIAGPLADHFAGAGTQTVP